MFTFGPNLCNWDLLQAVWRPLDVESAVNTCWVSNVRLLLRCLKPHRVDQVLSSSFLRFMPQSLLGLLAG